MGRHGRIERERSIAAKVRHRDEATIGAWFGARRRDAERRAAITIEIDRKGRATYRATRKLADLDAHVAELPRRRNPVAAPRAKRRDLGRQGLRRTIVTYVRGDLSGGRGLIVLRRRRATRPGLRRGGLVRRFRARRLAASRATRHCPRPGKDRPRAKCAGSHGGCGPSLEPYGDEPSKSTFPVVPMRPRSGRAAAVGRRRPRAG